MTSNKYRVSTTGTEALLEALRAEAVDVIPGLVGSAFMDMLDLMAKAEIRYLPMRIEATAGYFAQGYSRALGKPGLCIAQNGPGVSNLVTAVRDAYLAHAPMVVLTPSTSTVHVGNDVIQELDAMALFQPVVGHQIKVARPARIAEAARTAFRAAHHLQRPVQIDIPRDYFFEMIEADIVPPENYRTAKQGPGDSAAIGEATELLLSAQRPVILAGYGVVAANAIEDVKLLAEMIGAPVVTSYLHNDAFPFDHELSMGPVGYGGSRAAMSALSEADVLLVAGSRISEWGTLLPRYGLDFFPRKAKLIHIDRNAMQIGRTVPFDVGIVGDAKEALAAIAREARTREPQRAAKGLSPALRKSKDDWDAELRELSSSEGAPISPRRALWEISRSIPDGTIVATDIGNVIGVAGSYLRFKQPRTHLAALGYGGCGAALGIALGAKFARPEKPVVALIGDGSWGFSMIDLLTAVQQNLPLTVVILDNSQWGAEKRNQVEFYDKRFVGTNLTNPDFAGIACQMGAVGHRIDNPAEIGDYLKAAIASNKTTLLHLSLDSGELGEAYRRDALKAPKRVLPRYAS